MSRRSELQAIRVEGGLISTDLLARIAAGDPKVKGLKPEDYYLEPDGRLGDAIQRSWHLLRGSWHSLRTALELLPDGDVGTKLTRDRFLLPLFQELGYGRLRTGNALEVDGRNFAISHVWESRIPIHLMGAGVLLDVSEKGRKGGAMSSPHGLLQDLLNHSQGHLWGFVSNGRQLRVLRDYHSMTRQSYIEIDLESIFDGERYTDFRVLWLLCHQSRVGSEKISECWLERWFEQARDDGVRALDRLRRGVEQALELLGSGFVSHPSNTALSEKLASGDLDIQEYYRELLRLIYRLIFLFVAEDRGALMDPAASDAARDRYLRFYSSGCLRALADRRRGGPHSDLWHGLRLVMASLHRGEPSLGLPALGSFLWGTEAMPNLARTELSNEALLGALRALCYLSDGGVRRPVSWATLAADELGSIYESLMECHPVIHRQAGAFRLEISAGHERKTTGSYYTPSSLVECLLDSALNPVLDAASRTSDRKVAEQALLNLKVVDPACGSGHFLVAAARRIARRLAQVRSGDHEPSPADVTHALRDVVGRCLYGVDLNPMAVELCKVSLWMEAIEPGKPLSFLDAHIRHGNALLGATPALMARGIPDDAFKPLEGDDPAVATQLRKRNKSERGGQQNLTVWQATHGARRSANLAAQQEHVENRGDESLGAVQAKEQEWKDLVASATFEQEWQAADLWCAAFVWPKQVGKLEKSAPTHELWRSLSENPGACPDATLRETRRLARLHHFFHWHLAFPHVFRPRAEITKNEINGWEGGFDVVLGNPPWERIKLQEQEFFATRDPGIADAPNAAARKKRIAALPAERPELWREWSDALRVSDGESHLLRMSGWYPLCGRGDINTYAVFAELNRSLVAPTGRVGCIVPTGIATDDTTKLFFGQLVRGQELAALYSFENEEFVFPAIHHAVKFCLLTIVGTAGRVKEADLLFFARQVAALGDPERHFTLSPEEFRLINPNTLTCPTFRTRRDAEITKAIYRKVPVLLEEYAMDCESPVQSSHQEEARRNPWGISFKAMLHMANDSSLFRTGESLAVDGWELRGNIFKRGEECCLPLYEAKMIHHFDHRFGTYEGQDEGQANQGKLPEATLEQHQDETFVPLPRYWVHQSEVEARLEGRWDRDWFLGWRMITGSTNQRTLIAAISPMAGMGHSYCLILSRGHVSRTILLVANLSAFIVDYVSRQKVGGNNFVFNTIRQICVLPPNSYMHKCAWLDSEYLSDWIQQRALELIYTGWDLQHFSQDCGAEGAPFRWEEERRFKLRTELDAAFFHLYGVLDDDVGHIMDSFWIVKQKDEKAYGTYRTKDLILNVYRRMAEAIRTGVPYQTILDPPPAHDSCRHGYVAAASEERKLTLVPKPAVVVEEPLEVPDLREVAAGALRVDGTWDARDAIAASFRALGGSGSAWEVLQLANLACHPLGLDAYLSKDLIPLWHRAIGRQAGQQDAEISTQEWRKRIDQLFAWGGILLVDPNNSVLWTVGKSLLERERSAALELRAAFILHETDALSETQRTQEVRGYGTA